LPVKGFQPSGTTFSPFNYFSNFLFWAGAKNIYRYNIVTNMLDSVSAGFARHISVINEDSIWIGNSDLTGSLISFKTKNNQPIIAQQFDKQFNSPDFFINGSVALSVRYMLVAIRYKGFFVYDRQRNRFSEIPVLLGGNKITTFDTPSSAIYNFKASDIWFTLTDGLYYLLPENKGFNHFSLAETADKKKEGGSNTIRNFTEDKMGNIWIATINGFAKWNRQTNETKIYLPKIGRKDYLNFASIRGIITNGDKLIVAQSEGGVFVFDPVKETFNELGFPPGLQGDTLKKILYSDFISMLFPLKNGDYITGSNRRVYYIRKKDNSVSLVNFNKGSGHISNTRVLFEDKQRRIWFIGQPGIAVADSNFNILYKISDPKLNGTYANCITQVSDTTFWVAWEGLHEVIFNGNEPPQFKPIFAGLGNQLFFNIFKDSLGYCWASAEKGIYKLYPDKKSYHLFNQSDNVLNFHYSPALPYRCKDGTVLFPGYEGVTYFNPEKFTTTADSLYTNITAVKINNNDSLFFLNKAGLLMYYQNSIEINFIAPYVYNGGKVMYRYLLQGTDKDWINTGNNTFVRFSSLSHGNYKFRVAASLNGKDWFETQAPFVFEIKPPIWKTWWFRLISTLLISYLVFYFIRDRINKIKQREKFKRDYERKIAEVEMQALRAQMNPHFMFNSLNSINNFILKNDADNASGYLTKFSRLMRLILDNSRSEWVLLENELKALELYIELEAVRFDNTFNYNIEVTKDISIETVMVPPLLVQPYVENAIWHGLLHRKQPGGKLGIRLWKNNDTLYIEIEDNGVGREEAKRLKSKTATKQKSHGMRITAERMDIVNKVYNVDAGVTITDLKDGGGKQNGTRVLITLKYQTHDSHYSR
jgi:Histidine kinase/Y_Y_Y domain